MKTIVGLIALAAVISMVVPAYGQSQISALQPMPAPVQTQMAYTQCIDFNQDKICEYIVLANGTTIANPMLFGQVPHQQAVNPLYKFYVQNEVTKKVTVDKNSKPDLRRICALNPYDNRCDPDRYGNCPPGFGTNEDGQCFPRGDCPDGYHRANDDETGRCVPDDDLKQCEDGSWAYEDDTCPEDWEPVEPEPEEEILPPCSLVAVGETCDNTEDEDSWTDEEVEEESEPEEEEEEDNENVSEEEEEESEPEEEDAGAEEEAAFG